MKKKKDQMDDISAYKKYKNNSIGTTLCIIGFWAVIVVNILTYVLSETIWKYCWTIGLAIAISYLFCAIIYTKIHDKKLKELKIKAFGEPDKIEYTKMFKDIWREYNSEDLEMLQIFIKGERKFDTDDINNIIIVTMNMNKNKVTISFDNYSAVMKIVSKTGEEKNQEYMYEDYKDMVDLFNKISIDVEALKPQKKHK